MCAYRNSLVFPAAIVLLVALISHHQRSSCQASVQVHHQSTQNDYHESSQDKITTEDMPKDQTLVVRLPSNTLLKYTAYKDVSILHFRVPPDTRTAYFIFKAFEESKSAFQRKCKPREVTLHLKAGSYPVISPENITFPRNFLSADQRFKIYDLQFQSDETQKRITVEGPQIGNWFAVAFVSWTDPSNDRIEQQGLAASCETLLSAEMSVTHFDSFIINDGQVHRSNLTTNNVEQNKMKASFATASLPLAAGNSTANISLSSSPLSPASTNNNTTRRPTIIKRTTTPPSDLSSQSVTTINSTTRPSSSSSTINANAKVRTTNSEIIYKFYVPRNIGVATARITIENVCHQCPDVGFYVQANALPHTAMQRDAAAAAAAQTITTAGVVHNLKTNENNYIHSTIIKPNQTGEISIEFYVQPCTWHYSQLKFVHATSNGIGESGGALTDATGDTDENVGGRFNDLNLNMNPSAPENRRSSIIHNNKTSSTSNFTIWYELDYSLQIDFHRPIDGGFDSDKEKNARGETTSETSTFDTVTTTTGVPQTPHNYEGSSVNASEKSSSPSQPLPSPSASNSTTTEDRSSSSSSSSSSSPPKPWQPIRFRDMEFYPLLRQTYREFFMFDYDLLPDANNTVPTVLNLTAGTPAGFSFEVGDVYDIGGTLSFAVSMKHGLKTAGDLKTAPEVSATERGGILAEKLIGRPLTDDDDDDADAGGGDGSSSSSSTTSGNDSNSDDDNNDDDNDGKALARSNQTIIVCMSLGEPGQPTWPDKCRYGRKVVPASSIVNNTDSNTSTGLIHVPFPESGQWYVTMGLYCHGAETAARVTIIDSVKEFVKKFAKMLDSMRSPCACASISSYYQNCVNDKKCLAAMNETETLKVKECLMDSKCTTNYIEMTKKFEIHHKFATEQHFALDNCNTSVVFTVSSSPCVAGRCGRFGRCYHYMSGGFVFSTCVCMKGYRGWDCTEDTQVPSSMSILLASLLLTLSNLLFIPSIYMAIRRKYYTESVIYFFAMFFSIFYHACDSGEDEFSFCLVKIGVLQFCDFYCGLLAIWVTLVAMSHIRPQFVSLLHMFGAILLAFGTELNKQSLWVFLAPALTGICIISASWGLRCYKSRKWFPARKYLTVYMPLGTVLVMCGLVCYAFLQTKQNYHIVHSVWHMVMALSILCLLPSRKSFIPKC